MKKLRRDMWNTYWVDVSSGYQYQIKKIQHGWLRRVIWVHDALESCITKPHKVLMSEGDQAFAMFVKLTKKKRGVSVIIICC